MIVTTFVRRFKGKETKFQLILEVDTYGWQIYERPEGSDSKLGIRYPATLEQATKVASTRIVKYNAGKCSTLKELVKLVKETNKILLKIMKNEK